MIFTAGQKFEQLVRLYTTFPPSVCNWLHWNAVEVLKLNKYMKMIKERKMFWQHTWHFQLGYYYYYYYGKGWERLNTDSCLYVVVRWSPQTSRMTDWYQTKSCSSFPECLRLSFRPDRIFWAGEVRFVFGEWQCPALCLLLDMFVFRWARSPAVSFWEDIVVVPDDFPVDSNPNINCETSQGFDGTSSLFWLGIPESGEELRLLSALPGVPVTAAAGCSVAHPGFEIWVPGVGCQWYLTGFLLKQWRGCVIKSQSSSSRRLLVSRLTAKTADEGEIWSICFCIIW